MNFEDVYSLTNGRYIKELGAVDNLFIRQLYSLGVESTKQLKVVSYVTNDLLKAGEVNGTIINMNNLPALVNSSGGRTLFQEIAEYRFSKLHLHEVGSDFVAKNAFTFVTDYLLSACLCYVEVFDGTSRVDKYFATRNRFIAGGLAGLSDNETTKYIDYLKTYGANYQSKQIKVLKLNMNKSGYKIVQPRSYLDLNKTVKVTPLFLLTSFTEGIAHVLEDKMLKFTYIKDNLTPREFITTLNMANLIRYYDQEMVHKMLKGVEVKVNRGYIRLPELGISKYDATGVRALNLTRIINIEEVSSFDSSYIDVDFDLIIPFFKSTINEMRDIRVLAMVHNELLGRPPVTNNLYEMINAVNSFVDTQFAIGTTTAQRHIHRYMMSREMIFKGYNGGKPAMSSGFGIRGMNFGVEG